MDKTIADLRKDYTLEGLSKTEVDPNPFIQFKKWFEQALAAQLPEPNAMTIATTTPDGKPSARMVLFPDRARHLPSLSIARQFPWRNPPTSARS